MASRRVVFDTNVVVSAFDLPFLHLAAAGRATLVTGEGDLLVLAATASFDIVSIEAFLAGFDPA